MTTDWKRPEMIILARGEPEEITLAACKVDDVKTGPSICQKDCQCTELGIDCRVCKLRTSS